MHVLIITQGKADLTAYKRKLRDRGITYEEQVWRDTFQWEDGHPDWQWLRPFCEELYRSRRETIDLIKIFLDDWKAAPSAAGKPVIGRSYRGKAKYPVHVVKIRRNDDKTAEHEDFHTFDDVVRIYLGISLAGILGVDDFDEDVVHGRDPRFTEYEYDDVWNIIRPYVEAAYRKRKQLALCSVMERTLILLRQLLEKVQEREIVEKGDLLRWPLDHEHDRITQAFGVPSKRYPVTQHHVGIDIAAPVGSPIYAITNGRIVKVYENHETLGNACEFEFTLNGIFYTARFLHLQFVPLIGAYKRGDFIGRIGLTGDTDGAHLHLDTVLGTFDLTGISSSNWRDKFIDPAAIMERIAA